MPSNSSKSSNLPRITVSLDPFDDTVINMMATKTGKSKSEILRTIITQWIESNPDTLKSKYMIDFDDVRREMQIKNQERNIEDDLNELIRFFKRVKSIDIDRLAEKLTMSTKTLLDILDKYGDDLEKRGLNLIIEGNLVIKS
ncbi:MAG: ribbon-helix-helix domain-containing protein [Promethearchaeia archaeon]